MIGPPSNTQIWLVAGVTDLRRAAAILSSTTKLGSISDLPQGRDTLAAAMQQVERTERVLK